MPKIKKEEKMKETSGVSQAAEKVTIRKFSSKAEIDKIHQEEVNNFPIVFAFTENDLIEGGKKVWNIDLKEVRPQIVSIGAGGYILKSDVEAFKALLKQHDAEKKTHAQNMRALVAVIKEAMYSHEYTYTLDRDDVLTELGSYEGLPHFEEAWKKAEKAVLKNAA